MVLMDETKYKEKEKIFDRAKQTVYEYLVKCFNEYKFLLSSEEVNKMRLDIIKSLNGVTLSHEVITSQECLAWYHHYDHAISLSEELLNESYNDYDIFETCIHELFHAISRKNYHISNTSRGIWEEGFAEAFTYLVLNNSKLCNKTSFPYRCEADIIRTCLLLEKDKDIELLFRYISGDMKYFEERISNIIPNDIYKCTYNYDILNTAEMYQIEKLCFYELEIKLKELNIDEGKEIYKINNNLYSSLKKSLEVDRYIEKMKKYQFPIRYSAVVSICECSPDGYSNFIPAKLIELAKEEVKNGGIETVEHFSSDRVSFTEVLRTSNFLDYAIELYLDKKIDGNLTKEDCVKVLEYIDKYISNYVDDKFVLKKISALKEIIKKVDFNELSRLPYIKPLVDTYALEIFEPFFEDLLKNDNEYMTIDDLKRFKEKYGKLFEYELENVSEKETISWHEYSALRSLLCNWYAYSEPDKKDDILEVWPDLFEKYSKQMEPFIGITVPLKEKDILK